MGESGLLMALSSQLAFRLHRFESIVLDGLAGMESSASASLDFSGSLTKLGWEEVCDGKAGLMKPSLNVDSAMLLIVPEVPGLSFSLEFCTIVVPLWLDPGLELDRGELSRPRLRGLVSLGGLVDVRGPKAEAPKPLRLLAIELPRLSQTPACALHLLLTLSDLLSIALCTNPPSPFVGDDGRSGERRP